MRFLAVFFVACLAATPVGAFAFEGGWGEPSPEAVEPWPNFEEDYDVWAPTVRPPVGPDDFLPRGHEENFRRQYENQQYRWRYGGCANM